MKKHLIKIAILLMFLYQNSFAATGLLFNVSITGSSLSIRTTIPGHTYYNAGIKINTPGYTLSQSNPGCTMASNGYCLFTVNNTVAKKISITGPTGQLSVTLCLNGTGALSCQRYDINKNISGGLQCWGSNVNGQIGNNSTTDSSLPIQVIGLTSGVHDVANGNAFNCALLDTGAVQCWGANNEGQLGNGTNTNSTVPVPSLLTSGVQAITAGDGHACALLTSGGVKCWGGNSSGELGNGTNLNSNVPVDVSGLQSGVIAVSAGIGYSCALLQTGAVECWGSNSSGQLGNATNISSNTPVSVIGLVSPVTAISSGAAFTCALLSPAGTIQCWGANTSGGFGNGTTTNTNIAVPGALGLTNIQAITNGQGYSCAILDSGAAQCWGENSGGQLGDQSFTDSYIPVQVFGLNSGVNQIVGADQSACALLQDGTIQCWGINSSGQLGNGSTTNSNVPVTVSAPGTTWLALFNHGDSTRTPCAIYQP